MGAQIPVIPEKSLETCGCRKFQLDPLGDHLNTCTTHSGAKKTHDWRVSARRSCLEESVASSSRSAILEKMVRNASGENERDDENENESEVCELRTLH
jgi:hypothetical protein